MSVRTRTLSLAAAASLLIPLCAIAANNNRVIPGGTTVYLRTNQTIDTKTAKDGQKYSAEVNKDVIGENGNVVVPKGSDAELVLNRPSSGKLSLNLRSMTVNGHRYRVEAATGAQQGKEGVGMNKRTAKDVGGGALLGTIIGAIAGGGKGAAIGLLAGGAAGGVFQQATKGKSKIPAESVIHFKLSQPLALQSE